MRDGVERLPGPAAAERLPERRSVERLPDGRKAALEPPRLRERQAVRVDGQLREGREREAAPDPERPPLVVDDPARVEPVGEREELPAREEHVARGRRRVDALRQDLRAGSSPSTPDGAELSSAR